MRAAACAPTPSRSSRCSTTTSRRRRRLRSRRRDRGADGRHRQAAAVGRGVVEGLPRRQGDGGEGAVGHAARNACRTRPTSCSSSSPPSPTWRASGAAPTSPTAWCGARTARRRGARAARGGARAGDQEVCDPRARRQRARRQLCLRRWQRRAAQLLRDTAEPPAVCVAARRARPDRPGGARGGLAATLSERKLVLVVEVIDQLRRLDAASLQQLAHVAPLLGHKRDFCRRYARAARADGAECARVARPPSRREVGVWPLTGSTAAALAKAMAVAVAVAVAVAMATRRSRSAGLWSRGCAVPCGGRRLHRCDGAGDGGGASPPRRRGASSGAWGARGAGRSGRSRSSGRQFQRLRQPHRAGIAEVRDMASTWWT